MAWENDASPETDAQPHVREKTPVRPAERAAQAYAGLLLRVAVSYLKERHDAEDAVQTAFLRYMEKAPAFANEEHEKAWLIRVTVNICRNMLRAAHVRRTTTPAEPAAPAGESAALEVLDAVRRLPEKYRAPVALFYGQGYGLAETAALLGKKPSTAASLLRRARLLLGGMLKEGEQP